MPDLPAYAEFTARGVVARPAAPAAEPPVIAVGFEPGSAPAGATEHPMWLEGDEGFSHSRDDGRLQLISPMPAARLHAQWGALPTEAPPARLSPSEAARRGLIDGQPIRLWNERGSISATLSTDDGVADGVVSVDNGYPFVPRQGDGHCLGGNVNVLTADRPSSEWAQATTAHSCLVALSSEGAF